MSYVLTITAFKKRCIYSAPKIDIEYNVEQDRWDYSNKYNEWKGGGNQKQ
jgi:hypothetical protein